VTEGEASVVMRELAERFGSQFTMRSERTGPVEYDVLVASEDCLLRLKRPGDVKWARPVMQRRVHEALRASMRT
jgi:hypothetical protein